MHNQSASVQKIFVNLFGSLPFVLFFFKSSFNDLFTKLPSNTVVYTHVEAMPALSCVWFFGCHIYYKLFNVFWYFVGGHTT